MVHMLTYCQIVGESHHSAELQATLTQADKTHPDKGRIRIQTAVLIVRYKNATHLLQSDCDNSVSHRLSTRLCLSIIWSQTLICILLMSFLHRVSGAHISAAAKDEAGQKSLCRGVRCWPGAADSKPPHSLYCGAGGRFEDRHMQSQATWLRLLSPQQRPLVTGQHGEEHWLHAAGPGSGQDLR